MRVAVPRDGGDTERVRGPGRSLRTISRRVALLIVGLVLVSTGGCGGGRPPVPAPTAERSSAAPAEVRADLAERIERHLTTSQRYELVRSVIVLVDGETVFERYYQTSAQESHDIESVTKSVMATLVGIALAEGKLRSVDQTLAELLPDYAPGMKRAVAAITLRQVLTATAGFSGEIEDDGYNFAKAKDWTRGVLASASARRGRHSAIPTVAHTYCRPSWSRRPVSLSCGMRGRSCSIRWGSSLVLPLR